MKGEAQLWRILNDKLETLRASDRSPEATKVAESALGLARRNFASNDPSLAFSLDQLGQLLDQDGQLGEAKELLAEAFDIVANIDPPDQRALYRIGRRLALICDSLDQYADAIRYYEHAIRAGDSLPDVLHSDLGSMLNNLALMYKQTGSEAAAEPCYLRALEIYEKQLGPDHLDVASILNNIAVFYTTERRYPEAEQLHSRALAIRQRILPNDHPDIAQSKSNLAVVYHSLGEFAPAETLYRESLQAWEEAGEEPPDYQVVACNYAGLLRSLGKKRKAAAVERHALKCANRHPDAVRT